MVQRRDQRSGILVAGCGCLGSALVADLQAVADVCCYDTDPGIVARYRGRGVMLKGQKRPGKRLDIVGDMAGFKGRTFDGVVVSTKCGDIRKAAEAIARYCHVERVLFLQNGDQDLRWAGRVLGGAHVCRGVTTMAVQRIGAGTVDIVFRGRVYVGSCSGSLAKAGWFIRLFRSAGIPASVVRDHRSAVWAKLIFSAVMNPLPLMTGQDYRVIRDNDEVYRFVCKAMEEGRRVARASGIRLAFDPMQAVQWLRAGNRMDFSYTGSMVQDILCKRPSEIEYISGRILAQARKVGVKVPLVETAYMFIKALEKARAGQR